MEEGELESPVSSSHKQASATNDSTQIATATEPKDDSEEITSGTRSRWESDNEQSDEQLSERSSTYKKRKIAKNEQKRRKNQKEAIDESTNTRVKESPSQQQAQSPRHATTAVQWQPRPQLVPPSIKRCGSVDRYERLNRIDEGSYGIVYRARDRHTGEIVALKRLKCEHQDRNGFPVTDLREIHSLLWIKHENIVNVREIVVGSGAPPK
jgi:cell division cycle 2-like protein